MTSSRARAGGHALRSWLFEVLTRVLPTRRHAVVAGSPDDEGNSVEVVRCLSHRMRVYWLVSDEPEGLAWLVADGADLGNLRTLPKGSLTALLAYLTARYVFFTHGLYGSPKPPRRKTVVNLWHGDGPKPRSGFVDIASTYIVSGTQLWGGERTQAFGLRPDELLVTGNPRVDQFERPASDAAMRALGLDPQRPLVLWMPTFRRTDYRGKRRGAVLNWSDGEELSQSEANASLLRQACARAEEAGVTLVVKAHHLDADHYDETGIRCLTNQDLRDARVSLYQLLARSSGLVTDYSSVWTDYLVLRRPIGFYCPDLREYQDSRGLNVDNYETLIPGPLLETAGDFEAFFSACRDPSDADLEPIARCIAQVGAETRPGATERILSAVGVTHVGSRAARTRA